MTDVLILPAGGASPEERAELVNAAYADYYVALRVSAEQLESMGVTYDVLLERSVVARSGGVLTGMALLSCRGHRGWVSAVGVLPSHRGRGVATRLMNALLDNAREAGLRSVTLEVIDRNVTARSLYARLGFREVRELLSWRFPVESGPLPIPYELLEPAAPAELLASFDAWHESTPCWQREEATLRRMLARCTGYTVRMNGERAAYCLVNARRDALPILDVGINPAFGPVAAGRVLLQALATRHRDLPLTITNVPADDGMCRVLAALRFLVNIRQIEMRLEL